MRSPEMPQGLCRRMGENRETRGLQKKDLAYGWCSLVDSTGGTVDVLCEILRRSVPSPGTWSRNPPRAGRQVHRVELGHPSQNPLCSLRAQISSKDSLVFP